ncbi:E3 ubiquitin-protein ligase PUB23-like [Senna tora]|uniref:E3 ubiquitin-protein ligase PUB23-like n=1 Tax=Senna tora TaxID=362788 RepID=A0A834TQ49_9FABA|nr:E3 ubiquitin-protein ligase PUB23-like [Senna tora]
MDGFDLKTKPTDEALSLLHTHRISEPGLNNLLTFKHGDFVPCLTKIMQIRFYESRAYAVLLLKSILGAADSTVLSNLKTEMLVEENLGKGNILLAELWGIRTGLQLAWDNGLSNVTVESDLLVAINMIWNVILGYITRNGSWFADTMAKHAHQLPFGDVLYGNILLAKLWVIHTGLQLAGDNGLSNVTVDSDLLVAINMIWNVILAYIPRNGNRFADTLAKHAHQLPFGDVLYGSFSG